MKEKCVMILLAVLLLSTINVVNAQELKREESLILTDEEGVSVLPGRLFNPYSPDVNTDYFIGVFETLYIFDSVNFGLIPWIADGEPTWIDDYTLEVKLKNAYWQDGYPLTAEDVYYSYDLPRRYPETGGIALAMWPSLTKIEVVDDRTLRFHVNKTHPVKVSIYQVLCYAWIVPKHVFEQAEKKYESITEFPFENPVGSGPYKLMSWESSRIIHERWDDWWGVKYFGLPEPKYIIYKPSTGNEETNRMLSLAEADGISAIAPNWKDMQKDGVYSWFKDPPYTAPFPVRVNFFAINNERFEERFGEYGLSIKLAIAYGIDKEVMCERGFFKLAVPIPDPTYIMPDGPLAFLRNENVVKNYTFTYDPEKAMKILDDAGIKDTNNDGIRELPDGTPVTLEAIDVEGWTDWMAINELLVSYMQAIGIGCTISHLDYSVWAERVRGGDFDLITYVTSAWSPAGLWYFYSIFDYRYPRWPCLQGTPLYYKNEELNSLLDELAQYPDPFDPEAKPALKELVGKIQEIIAKDLPAIPIGVWGYEFGFQTKYWRGWPTAENPYAFAEQGDPGFLNVLLHLKSTTAPTPTIPTAPVIPAGLNETVTSIYNTVSGLNATVSSVSNKVESLSSEVESLRATVSGLQSWLGGIIVLNVIILIVVAATLAASRKRG